MTSVPSGSKVHRIFATFDLHAAAHRLTKEKYNIRVAKKIYTAALKSQTCTKH